MYRNPFWLAFVGLILIGAFIFTGIAACRLWNYAFLNRQTSAQNIKWSVLSLDDDQFIPVATYTFTLNEKQYQGKTQLQESFLNEWTAREAAERLIKSPPPVWYQESNPSISSIEKLFPVKHVFYSILLWILAIYLIGLGAYVNRRLSS